VLNDALRVEQHNLDLVYLLGICYIFNSNYEEAIAIFEDMLRSKPKKNIYLLLSVCFKKTEKFEQTEDIVNYQ
jgi:cytochrome c-type biogenesis protein CcmH/NrfG